MILQSREELASIKDFVASTPRATTPNSKIPSIQIEEYELASSKGFVASTPRSTTPKSKTPSTEIEELQRPNDDLEDLRSPKDGSLAGNSDKKFVASTPKSPTPKKIELPIIEVVTPKSAKEGRNEIQKTPKREQTSVNVLETPRSSTRSSKKSVSKVSVSPSLTLN